MTGNTNNFLIKKDFQTLKVEWKHMVTEISHTWSQKQKSAITETAAAVASRDARENGRKEKTKKAFSPRKEKRRLELARTTHINQLYMP